MIRQRSLKSPIRASGIGLHGGRKVYISILPAPVNHGIVFRRVDLSPAVDIPASALLIGETTLCSTLVRDGVKVATVEHIMSALAGMGIDNVLVELSSPEIPIMDGSAAPFMYLLQSAGVVEQNAPRKFIRILQPVQVGEGDKYARLEPYEGFRLSFGIEFKHPAFKTSAQTATLEFTTANYIKEVSRARTFGFMRDVEKLWASGHALGSSLENSVVISDDNTVINVEGLRYAKDEFVRHKTLDAVGDLALAGAQFIGCYRSYRGGHKMNAYALKALLSDRTAYEVVEAAVPRSRAGQRELIAVNAPEFAPWSL